MKINKKTKLTGPAALAEKQAAAFINIKKDLNMNCSLLFTGAPGTGKTTLVKNLIFDLTNGNAGTVHYYNGRNVGIKEATDLINKLSYSNLFSNDHIVFIDELDSISKAAEDILLQNYEFTNVLFFATSNKNNSDFVRRFQSRFDINAVEAPTVEEIKLYLIEEIKIIEPIAARIASVCEGDLRAAINDALKVQMIYNNPELQAA